MEGEVKAGDVWAVGDRFFLGVGDHEEQGHARLLKFMRKYLGEHDWRPDVLYADLPWTDAIAMQFRRYADAGMPKRFQDVAGVAMGARGAKGFLTPLLEVFARAATDVRGDVYIEMGKENTQLTIDIFEAVGLALMGKWPITYARGKSPCMLLHFNFTKDNAATGGDPTGMDDGLETILWAASRSLGANGGWVYDYCTGKGTTPKVLLGAGQPNWKFVGLELRPATSADTIHKAARSAGLPARKVGEL